MIGPKAGGASRETHGTLVSTDPVATPAEALDKIARSGEAVFAIDSSDRIILWNKKCEEMLVRPARAVLGKRCYDVIGGRDENGNVYCYRNCPVAHQARDLPKDPVQRLPALGGDGMGGRRRSRCRFSPSRPTIRLFRRCHVLRDEKKKVTALEREPGEGSRRAGASLAHGNEAEGEPVDLTAREKEILRCLAEGMTTPAIGRTSSFPR